MSIWGPGPFDNDDGADWFAELTDEPSLESIRDVLEEVSDPEYGYLEVTDGAEVVAAAEVLAELLGSPGDEPVLDEEHEDLAAALKEEVEGESRRDLKKLVQQAIAALEIVLNDAESSELRQMWEEQPEQLPAWTAAVSMLQQRLRQIVVGWQSKATKKSVKKSKKSKKAKQSPTKQKYKVGQVVAIPLPDQHKYAYAKVFNDFDLGVYNFLSDEIEPLERVVQNPFLYFNAVTDRAIKNGEFIVIGEQPFPDEESAWAPPMATGVVPGFPGVGALHIVHKGVSRRATLLEANGMDIQDFSQRTELFVRDIVDRLVKGNNQKYRVKVCAQFH